jgi:hypothetical protein
MDLKPVGEAHCHYGNIDTVVGHAVPKRREEAREIHTQPLRQAEESQGAQLPPPQTIGLLATAAARQHRERRGEFMGRRGL